MASVFPMAKSGERGWGVGGKNSSLSSLTPLLWQAGPECRLIIIKQSILFPTEVSGIAVSLGWIYF